MRIRPDEEAPVLRATASALNGYDRVVLAVSGGLDSMVLLDAAAATFHASRSGILVATFDHRTGPAASLAVKSVKQRCASMGLQCVTGLASATHSREHEWREERWKFLRATAVNFKAPVVTAHTLDDQVETVFMRILRDAGPRGLAGLYAESDVVRPFLGLRRKDLVAYAEEKGIRYVDDPSNESRAHLRNRVRHDLLPAMTRVRPAFPQQLLKIAGMSAAWRTDMAAAIEAIPVTVSGGDSLRVARADLAGYDADSLRCLWPALAAKVGVVMDRRGTQRLAEFTMNGHTGGSIQLSGGIEVRMFRDHLLLARWDAQRVEMIRNARLGTRWAGQSHRPELS